MPGGPEIAVILLIALIVLGPQQLPKAMRTLGNAMAEIRKISNGFQAEMRSAMDAIETQGGETPATGTPVDPAAEANVTEVVVRNPAIDEQTIDEKTIDAPADRDPVPSADPRPAVDPADRAAG